jgi:hypothetical protein
MVQNHARDARGDIAVDDLRAHEPLERQPERHRGHRQVDLTRVERRLRPMVVGVALEGRDEGPLEARVDGREALAQRGPADDVRPELEEGRQPAIVAPAAAARVCDHGLDPVRRVRCGGECPFELEDRALHAALVDGEEEVLLGREVRVHRALRVAGGLGDLVDRGCVKPALDEEPVGGRQDPFAGVVPLLGARPSHTVGICIPMVSGIASTGHFASTPARRPLAS